MKKTFSLLFVLIIISFSSSYVSSIEKVENVNSFIEERFVNCHSPEICSELRNFFKKALIEGDLSYCDQIYAKNLSPSVQRYDGEYYILNSWYFKKECYEKTVFNINDGKICQNIGDNKIHDYCYGDPSPSELCIINAMRNIRESCYYSIAKKSGNSEYCSYLHKRDYEDRKDCFKYTGNPKFIWYSYLLFLHDFKQTFIITYAWLITIPIYILLSLTIFLVLFILLKRSIYSRSIFRIIIFSLLISLFLIFQIMLFFFTPVG